MPRFPMSHCAPVALAVAAFAAIPAHAASSNQSLVDRSTLAVQDLFEGTTPTSRAQRYLAKARAVMICPSVFHMSIGIGGAGGGCLLLSRDARGSWSDPAFYTLSSASLGIQFGVENSQLMLFVMSDHGLRALLDSQFKFSAGASASFADMGSGIEDGNAGAANTDIMALQKSQGLFAGASLGGSKLTVDSSANRNYYNQSVGPEDIVITMRVNNVSADPLRRILMQVAKTQADTSAVASSVKQAAAHAEASPTTPAVGSSPYPTNYNSARSYSSQEHGSVSSQPLTSPK